MGGFVMPLEFKLRERDRRVTYRVLGNTRSKYRILVGKSEGNKPL